MLADPKENDIPQGTEYALDSDELKEGLEEHLAEQSIQIKHTQVN